MRQKQQELEHRPDITDKRLYCLVLNEFQTEDVNWFALGLTSAWDLYQSLKSYNLVTQCDLEKKKCLTKKFRTA